MNAMKDNICTLTFDIEEWFQVENLKGAINKGDWDQMQSSVEKNTKTILDILSNENVPATFFILGWIAERNPGLVKAISEAGHEIASHGNAHDLTYDLSNDQLTRDISSSKKRLEDITGKQIYGYRAPNFSVDDRLIQTLVAQGFKYDSSYNPFKLNSRYGSIKLPKTHSRHVYHIGNQFYEIPVSTIDIFSYPFPIAGGAYFRLFPFSLFKGLVKRLIKEEKFYNFYLHPWEFEPDQPRMEDIKFNYKLRHYTGLKYTEEKFKQLIRFMKGMDAQFITINNYVDLSFSNS